MHDTAADNAKPGSYQAQTQPEEHLQALLEELPRMQRIQESLAAHHDAGQILSRYAGVDDLESDIEQLQAKDPERDGIDPKLFELLLKEKRSSLARERSRFEHDLDESRFSSVPQAAQARIPEARAREMEDELNRYREDYAYTLARCQADAAK